MQRYILKTNIKFQGILKEQTGKPIQYRFKMNKKYEMLK